MSEMTPAGYRNFTEIVVDKALREYLRHEDAACVCDKCQADMAAVALNRLKPRYFTTDRGASYFASEQENVDFVSAVVGAIRVAVQTVARNPRHGDQQTNGALYRIRFDEDPSPHAA
jgi:competence protein ComFB